MNQAIYLSRIYIISELARFVKINLCAKFSPDLLPYAAFRSATLFLRIKSARRPPKKQSIDTEWNTS